MPKRAPPVQLFTFNELIRRLHASDSIPALDENVAQLCRLTSSNSTNAADLTLIIMRDAALTSRLLAMANSAIYRPRTPVKTISAAVILLGFERIQQLSLGLTLFHKHAANIRDKELYRLLVCTYCTGNLAMHIARAMEDDTPEELFVAGLLCQLPRLVLANGFPDRYEQMAQLVIAGKCDIDDACKRIFGVRFEEISLAIAKHWNLVEPISRQLQSGTEHHGSDRRRAVRLAVDVSDMLFGNRSTGPEAVKSAARAIADLIHLDSLSLPDFVGASAAGDPNMTHFFNLTEQDLVMMTRIAEWGKVSSSEVANSLTANFRKRPEPATQEVEEPLQMAYFLSELMVAVRKRYKFNDILMMAQEGVYRCIHPDCVIASFIDSKRKTLQGRLYAGGHTSIAVSRYRVTLDNTQNLATKNMQSSEAMILPFPNKQPILDDDHLLNELGIASILLVPIMAGDRAIGQFLLGRRADQPLFTPDDCLWMSAIAGHVGMSFEQIDS